MGISDKLLNADVGRCPDCNILYVTFAEIFCNDSHARVIETYACPTCKEYHPKDIKPATGDLLSFASKQLNKRLCHQKPYNLEILTSKIN